MEGLEIIHGAVIETTSPGLLARVAGPGDGGTLKATANGGGVWMTEGRYRPLAPDLHAPTERTEVLEARIDCLVTHSGPARLADVLTAIHSRAGEDTINLTTNS